jgi:hypothetical protein
MNTLHDIKLGLEIYGIAAGSLIAISGLIALGRRIWDRNAPVFVYPQDVPKAEAQAASEGYLHRCLVALDICMNVIFMAGHQSETMSTHAWRASLKGRLWGRLMNLWLNGFQAQHGPQAASGDLFRSQTEVNRMRKQLGV